MPKSEPSVFDCVETGLSFFKQQRFSEAAGCFEAAILRDPNAHEAWNNRGNALQAVGNYFDSIQCYEKAIAISPGMAGYHSNAGAAWAELPGQTDKALACYLKSIEIDPMHAEGHYNIGNLHRALGEPYKAIPAYHAALAIRPEYVEGNLALSFCELETGDFVRGWERFEWRWKCGQLFPRGLPFPQWEGEDLNGKSIVLYAEQGHGDALQFARFVNVLRDRYPDAVIDLEVRLPLVRIASTLRGVDRVITLGEPPGDHDYACALMSVPRVIGLTVDQIPGECPYFAVLSDRVAKWREELDRDLAQFHGRMKIGLCWAGMNRPMQPGAAAIDKRRSMRLHQFAPIASDHAVYVSLQKGAAIEEVRNPPPGMVLADSTEQFDDFADTAALIECLDLVISVDTAVAHLAAAIGKPTWMLSRFDGCWRWMGDRPDSPWYPTLRQFRQPKPGDWDSVMREVRAALGPVLLGAPPIPAMTRAEPSVEERLVPQYAAG